MSGSPEGLGLILARLEEVERLTIQFKGYVDESRQRDNDQDKHLENLEKRIAQNTTSINTLLDSMSTVVPAIEKSNELINRAKGGLYVLSFIGIGFFSWLGYSQYVVNEEIKQIVKEVSYMQGQRGN